MAESRTMLVCMVLVELFAGPAWAASSEITFDYPLNPSEFASLRPYMDSKAPGAFKVDLNEDGIEEFIVKSQCQQPDGQCLYKILANADDKIVVLGAIHAKAIMLGNGYTEGVRNLVAFKNTLNDFDRTVYVWEPTIRQYTMKR